MARTYEELLQELVQKQRDQMIREEAEAEERARPVVKLPETVVQAPAPKEDPEDRRGRLLDSAYEAKGRSDDAAKHAQELLAKQPWHPVNNPGGQRPVSLGELSEQIVPKTAPAANIPPELIARPVNRYPNLGHPLAIMEPGHIGAGGGGAGGETVQLQGRDGQMISVPREVLTRLGLGGIK